MKTEDERFFYRMAEWHQSEAERLEQEAQGVLDSMVKNAGTFTRFGTGIGQFAGQLQNYTQKAAWHRSTARQLRSPYMQGRGPQGA